MWETKKMTNGPLSSWMKKICFAFAPILPSTWVTSLAHSTFVLSVVYFFAFASVLPPCLSLFLFTLLLLLLPLVFSFTLLPYFFLQKLLPVNPFAIFHLPLFSYTFYSIRVTFFLFSLCISYVTLSTGYEWMEKKVRKKGFHPGHGIQVKKTHTRGNKEWAWLNYPLQNFCKTLKEPETKGLRERQSERMKMTMKVSMGKRKRKRDKWGNKE